MDTLGLPGGSVVKNPPANAGDLGLIPESRRSPGVGNAKPCLGNPMDRGTWRAIVQPSRSMGCKRVRHDLETKQCHANRSAKHFIQ